MNAQIQKPTEEVPFTLNISQQLSNEEPPSGIPAPGLRRTSYVFGRPLRVY